MVNTNCEVQFPEVNQSDVLKLVKFIEVRLKLRDPKTYIEMESVRFVGVIAKHAADIIENISKKPNKHVEWEYSHSFFIHIWTTLIFLVILMKKIINEMEIFMAVIRVQKTDNYTVMSNHHLRNKNMSLKAKGLMSLMLSLPATWDYSIGGLVAICKESHTSIRNALKELEENQYLIRSRKNNEKGYFTYEYTLYEIPPPHADKQHTDSVYADKQYAEEVHTVSNRQISKDELNKDKLNKEKINKDKTTTNKSKIKKNRISSYDEILNSSVTNNDLKELYKDFIEAREAMDAPITRQGLKVLIDRCEKLSNNNIRIQKLLLETALVNGWKNVFLPSETHQAEAKAEAMNELREFYGGGVFEE